MDEHINDRVELRLPTIEERVKKEKALRKEICKNVLKFGVNYLDRAMEGIAKNDLILIGAVTGSGKTELVTHIGTINAHKGKRVLFFALEAEDCEIERRITFKIASYYYFNDPNPNKAIVPNVSYRNFYYGKLNSNFEKYEAMAEEYLTKKFPTFSTVYRKNEFKVDDLQRYLLLYKDQTDLVIIDHLNYFDVDDPNENRAFSEIMKKIRDLALLAGRPIIVVAHIRKTEKKFRSVVPDIEDFMGTSNIPKIATKAIFLAPDAEAPKNSKQFITFMRAAKFRVDSTVNRYVARCTFNIDQNKYDDEFELGSLSSDGKTFTAITDQSQMPYWAVQGED